MTQSFVISEANMSGRKVFPPVSGQVSFSASCCRVCLLIFTVTLLERHSKTSHSVTCFCQEAISSFAVLNTACMFFFFVTVSFFWGVSNSSKNSWNLMNCHEKSYPSTNLHQINSWQKNVLVNGSRLAALVMLYSPEFDTYDWKSVFLHFIWHEGSVPLLIAWRTQLIQFHWGLLVGVNWPLKEGLNSLCERFYIYIYILLFTVLTSF